MHFYALSHVLQKLLHFRTNLYIFVQTFAFSHKPIHFCTCPHIWHKLAHFGTNFHNLVQTRTFWHKLVHFDTNSCWLAHFRTNSCIFTKTQAFSRKFRYFCANLRIFAHNGIFIQFCTNLRKLVQTCAFLRELMHFTLTISISHKLENFGSNSCIL